MKKIIAGVVIVGVAFFIFWPENKPKNKDNFVVDYSYELREITAELREQNNAIKEQTELLKRMIQAQESQGIYLSSIDAHLKTIEFDIKYK